MRCKKHSTDLSASIGVCASCLRERLISIIAAQQALERSRALSAAEDHYHRRNSDANPPPLIFPRSVSPYICRRSDADSNCHHHHSISDLRFYSTPQVNPTYNSNSGFWNSNKKRENRRFSLFSSLFRSRSEKLSRGRRDSSSSSSSSWFSSILPHRRRNKESNFCTEENSRQKWKTRDRGMSPVRGSDEEEDCEEFDRSASASGYSSESSPGWKKTPKATPPPTINRRGKPFQGRNVAGIAFCLSPMVRASPNQHRKGMQTEMGISGEIRVPAKPHLCANRSRKLADFGRLARNH
ncbi:hypothetical protein RJ641_015798 [Dillenia turbinata]|uniref:Uncharacterized protein n=1 Tax=Dillenia turbinata TaxID=194707 RepID=A0AAN8UVD4_9MAGN